MSKRNKNYQSQEENLSSEELENLAGEAKTIINNDETMNNDLINEDLQTNANLFKIALEKLEKQLKLNESLEQELNSKLIKLAEDKVNFEQQKKELQEALNKLNKEKKELMLRQGELIKKEQQLSERELNAEVGFIKQNSQALAQFEQQTEDLRQQRDNLYQEIAQKRQQFDLEIAEKRDDFEQEKRQLKLEQEKLSNQQKDLESKEEILKTKEVNLRQKEKEIESKFNQLQDKKAEITRQEKEISANQDIITELENKIKILRQESINFKQEIEQQQHELENERHELAQQRKQLKKEQIKLQTEQELLEEDQENLEEKIKQKSISQIEKLEAQIKYREEQLKESHNIRNSLQQKLIKNQETKRSFGHKEPSEILAELENLRQINQQLEEKLASKPSEVMTEKLASLEAQQEQWESERFRLMTKLQELERNSTYNKIAVTEVETLRDQKEALEISNSRLKTTLEELKTEVGEAIINAQNISAFTECVKLDEKTRLQTETPLEDNIPNLKEFAQDLQYRIAKSPIDQSKRLYYSLRNIRIFLGGLAMSRLHLLQGISGTGKTSLPIAFARAVNGGSKLIEVQAGWRDKQDLIGYYNAFEKRFYESEFLQAIYSAQCPFYQDKIYLIILDEMNLSRPEQYFADFLSKLEQESPQLTLINDSNRPIPALFKDHKTLNIPNNIWFIGTANQDETTLEFADKTYDRSHIMELERHQEEFTIPDLNSRNPIAYSALIKAFKKAENTYQKEANQAFNFLNEYLAKLLETKFKVGWGNRLERQIKSFIPVVIASGGTIGEATDHILATKILRKIKDRYDLSATDLRQLKEELTIYWSELDQNKPKESLNIINNEIKRIDSTGEE
jgi:hypothetical protein